VLFIGTQYSNLYTAVDTPAEAAWRLLSIVLVAACHVDIRNVLSQKGDTKCVTFRRWGPSHVNVEIFLNEMAGGKQLSMKRRGACSVSEVSIGVRSRYGYMSS
jgi:hypothetical protein